MLVSVLDVGIVILLGVVTAVTYRQWLSSRNVHWYLLLTLLCVGVVWLNLALANVAGTPYWGVDVRSADVATSVGFAYAFAYLFWFRVAAELTFITIGRHPDQGGLVWVARIGDRTDEIEPAWQGRRNAWIPKSRNADVSDPSMKTPDDTNSENQREFE